MLPRHCIITNREELLAIAKCSNILCFTHLSEFVFFVTDLMQNLCINDVLIYSIKVDNKCGILSSLINADIDECESSPCVREIVLTKLMDTFVSVFPVTLVSTVIQVNYPSL